jgi:hypothetical protein
MVEIIVLKKGVVYPTGFRDRVRNFNNALLLDHDPYFKHLLDAFPGSQIQSLVIHNASDAEEQTYFELLAIRQSVHEAHLI